MIETNSQSMPFSEFIKQRRKTLGLTLEHVAEALRVVPETVSYWERQKRRIDLDRLPSLAAILQLDEQEVCRLALAEHHPEVYNALFGTEPPSQSHHLEQ